MAYSSILRMEMYVPCAYIALKPEVPRCSPSPPQGIQIVKAGLWYTFSIAF
jgi:hypothetical protein